MADNVNHPNHYTSGDIECIDAIKSALGNELFCGYLWGNAIKYLWRWPRKNRDEDLAKCEWYIERIRAEGYAESGIDEVWRFGKQNPKAKLGNRALHLLRGLKRDKGGKL